MKIAIASEGNRVAEHFGHCSNFNICEVENGELVSKETIDNPGHRPGFLPNYLKDLGVDLVVSGGMGRGAIDIFNENKIEVVTGASGEVEEIVKLYLDGSLKSTGSVCDRHEHKDECGEHKHEHKHRHKHNC